MGPHRETADQEQEDENQDEKIDRHGIVHFRRSVWGCV
jgi:hypothetical protein